MHTKCELETKKSKILMQLALRRIFNACQPIVSRHKDTCIVEDDSGATNILSSSSYLRLLLWSPYVIGQTIIFSSCSFFLPSSFFLSSPNLSGRRLDVYHTLTHGVALVRIQNAGLKDAARGSLQMQHPKKSPKIAIWAPSHNFVGLYLRN